MNRAFRSMLFGAVIACAMVAPIVAAEQPVEDPAAMATQYAAQAADLRASAARHAKIAKMHRSGSAGSSKTSHASIATHCEKIAAKLNDAASDTDALAAEYRKLATAKAPVK